MGTRRNDVHGILLVDKPAGTSSAGVVREVKRALGGVKVGHLGTLDPFATGLLPLCVGEGSKVVPFLNQEDKAYTGILRLGAATDTLDATGETLETKPVPAFDDADLERIASRFRGEIEQVPPMYSAVKQGGVPLYRLARKGVVVERAARRVQIHRLALRRQDPARIAFEVLCSKGTYVRVLGATIAEALDTVGHLETLRRTRFGPFGVEDAVPPAGVTQPGRALLGPAEALADCPGLPVSDEAARQLRLGQQGCLASLPPPVEAAAGPTKLLDRRGDLVALVGADGAAWKLLRVFSGSAA